MFGLVLISLLFRKFSSGPDTTRVSGTSTGEEGSMFGLVFISLLFRKFSSRPDSNDLYQSKRDILGGGRFNVRSSVNKSIVEEV